MKRITFYAFACVLSAALLFSCRKTDKPADFDYGTIEKNQYVNKYFNCKLDIPTGWQIKTSEEMEQDMQAGQKLLAGDNLKKQVFYKVAAIKTATLLSISKPGATKTGGPDPSLIIVAENLTGNTGIKRGSDYLLAARQLLISSPINYTSIDSVFSQTKLSSVDFYSMNAAKGNIVSQCYYSGICKQFSFNIIITYTNETQHKELTDIIQTLRFE